jgi:hypothetical protein
VTSHAGIGENAPLIRFRFGLCGLRARDQKQYHGDDSC